MTTSENNKRIAKNTLFLYFRMLITMAVTLYTSRVVLSALGVVDYGIYNVVGGVVAMFSFLNGAMSSSTQRYLTFELGKGDTVRLNQVFNASLRIHLGIALGILILGETIGLWFLNTQMNIPADRMNAAQWVYQLSILASMVTILSIPYNAVIIAYEKMSAFAYISIIEVSLKLLIVYLLLLFRMDKLILYAFLMLAVSASIRMIYTLYCNKQFKTIHTAPLKDKKLLKEMTGFAGWNMFGNLAAIGFSQGINILLNIFFGPVVNAARGITTQVQGAIQQFCTNFQIAMNPQITKSYAADDTAYLHSLIFRSSRFSFYLLLILSLPVMMETETILSIWLKEVPPHTVNFIRLTLCIGLVDSVANPLITAAQATGRIKIYQIVVGGILLLIIPTGYTVLKMGFAPESVIIIHLTMVIIAQTARLIMIRPMIHLSLRQYILKVGINIILTSLAAIVLPLLLHYYLPKSFISFMVICLCSTLSAGVSSYLIGFSKNEKIFIKEKVCSCIHKK